MSDSLGPHGLQHTRLPCPSLSPRVYSNSCPLSWWCHPTISSSATPFSCPQSCPASGSFPMSQLFSSGGQSIRALASVLSTCCSLCLKPLPIGICSISQHKASGQEFPSRPHPISIPSLHSAQFIAHSPPGGEGNGNPLQYSCLENPMDVGAW